MAENFIRRWTDVIRSLPMGERREKDMQHNELRELVEEMRSSANAANAAGHDLAYSYMLGWVKKFESLLNRAPAGGWVVVPPYRGYAKLGLGAYLIDHSAHGQPAELVISVATEAEKAGRTVGDLRDTEEGAKIPVEKMAVRLEFANVAGLDALEQQLRILRSVHFGTSPAAPVAEEVAGESELDYRRRQMNAVWDFLRPNESNDMDWADEIIIAIQNRAPAVEVGEAFAVKLDAYLWREHGVSLGKTAMRAALSAALGREGGGNG